MMRTCGCVNEGTKRGSKGQLVNLRCRNLKQVFDQCRIAKSAG